MTLSIQAIHALKNAVAQRGKNKGMLLAQCPASDTPAAAAWQGAMLVCNPYKYGIATALLFSEQQRTIHDEIKAFFEAMPKHWVISMQRDRKALETWGVW